MSEHTSTPTTTPTTTTRHGSCHCGAVHFEVDIDATTATQCNCTICRKINGVMKGVKPEAFRVLQGESALTTYANAIGARYFCKVCGIHVYGDGDLPEMGGKFVSVNFNTFDNFDVVDVELGHWDGLHNNWQAGLRKTPWPRAA